MKAKKFLYSLLLILVASFFAVQPAFAITRSRLEMFVENNIMFWDPDDVVENSCYSTSANLVEETDRASIIWNWFVKANIPNISNNAEVIAGILGNFEQENSAFDPFSWSGWGHGAGLFRATASEDSDKSRAARFIHDVEKVFGSDIWNKTSTLDAATVKRGIETELNLMIGSDYNWNGSDFPNLLHIPTNKAGEDGAAAYAELFMLVFEIPSQFPTVGQFPTNSQISAFKIQDPGVASFELVRYPSRETNYYYSFGYTNGQPRRSYLARSHYRRFSNSLSSTANQTTTAGSDILVIGDDSINNARTSITQTIDGVEIKTVNNLSEVASAISDTSRKTIVIDIDLSKEILGEDNLSSALANTGSKNIYFIADQSLNTNNDFFEPNRALVASKDIQIIHVNDASEIATKVSNLIEKPVINMCSTSLIDSSNNNGNTGDDNTNNNNDGALTLSGTNIDTYASYAKFLGKLRADSDKISCPGGTIPVKNYAGTSYEIKIYIGGTVYKAHLCNIPFIRGSTKTGSQYKGETFKKCKNPSGKNITVPYQNNDAFDFDTDIQKPAQGAVFNASVAQIYYVFGEYMKALLNLSEKEGLPAASTYRSQAFQAIISAVNPYRNDQQHEGSCSVTSVSGKEIGGWSGAGSSKSSNHVAGHALDLDTGAFRSYYTNNKNGFKTFVDSLPVNHKCFYNSDKKAVVDINEKWYTAKETDKNGNVLPEKVANNALYNKFYCNVLPKFHLYFTVGGENWHIEPKDI